MIPIARRLSWLTAREREILALVMEGLSGEEIAVRAHVSLPTVRTHIKSILQKLGCNSQLQAVAITHRAMWGEGHWGERLAEVVGQ